MNKIKMRLSICGTECTFTSKDNETYVLVLGDRVEKSIQNIVSKNGRVSLTLAAIITVLSFCDDAKKAATAANNLRSQIRDYLEDSSRGRLGADEAHHEIERMKQEIQTPRACLSTGEAAQSPARGSVRSVPATPMQERPVPSPKPKFLEGSEGPESPFEREQPEENRPAAPAIPDVHTGRYSRPASTQVLEELDRNSFMSFLEKKKTD